MTRLEGTDSIMDIIVKLSDWNPGALNVCTELNLKEVEIDKDCALHGIGALLILDGSSIYGADIWMLYKDVCGEDIEKVFAILRSCQLGFITVGALRHAITHYGEGIDVDMLLVRVKESLPNFGRNGGAI